MQFSLVNEFKWFKEAKLSPHLSLMADAVEEWGILYKELSVSLHV